jgi:type IV secretion system protein VirD4
LLWLADQPGEQKTLGRAREIVSLTRKDFTAKYLIPMAASEAFSGAIREMAAPFIDLADETYSGVMSNLSEATKFLSDPQIKAATAKSSFAMEDLATRKATVYVVIPTERMDTQKTWLRLVIASAMHIFKHPQAKLPYGHRCLFLIDEFAALGRLDDLPRDIATMSGFGVDFALIVQGLDQLKDHYAEARGTILSNCAYKWFCDVNDLDSAKYLSDTLGKATVRTTSTSTSTSKSGPSNRSTSESDTTSHSETGRSLLNPDEVLNLGRDVAITIQPKGHPHYLRPVDYWDLTKAFVALRQNHPTLYWQPPIAYDENPYFAPPPPPPPPPGGDGGQGKGAGRDGASGAREKARSKPPNPETFMTKERAREILEVGPNASPDEIRAAYLKLIPKVHPDNGGSTYLTKEVNAAKDVLLGQ